MNQQTQDGDAVIELDDIDFRWPGQAASTLQLPHFRLGKRDQVFLSGPSGSGKSTLLALIGGIVLPQSGRVRLLGRDMRTLSASARDRFRVDRLHLSAIQSDSLPLDAGQRPAALPVFSLSP